MHTASRQIADNLARVQERIARSASRAGRNPDEITLIAVSKTHSAAEIRALYEAGVRHFGENRVQEREGKAAQLADLDIAWHMVGHLQKNKATRAVGLFDSIDSVDSAELVEKLDRACEDALKKQGNIGEPGREPVGKTSPPMNRRRVLIEVKLDPEPAKSGVDAGDLPRVLRAAMQAPRLDLRGLMGIPPYFDNPEKARPYFRRLNELRDSLTAQLPPGRLPVLSIGMSHDFEIAIAEGATEIRVGTALFGERVKA